MKNPITAIVILAVVVVLGIGAYTLSQNSSKSTSMMKNDEAVMAKDPSANSGQEAVMEKTDGAMMKENDSSMKDDKMATSRYVQYSKPALDSASSARRVLFFYANWCPSCKPANADFEANSSKIPTDLTVIRVNYNDTETDKEEKDLAKKYGITYQHTYVQIDSSGKVVTKWNGGQLDELLSNIK